MNRRGYMLVEVVAVIGPSAVIMGVALAVIHSTFDVERSLRGQLAARQAVDRLAESFQRDVHAAEHATIATDPPQCILSSAGYPTVVYRFERGQVVRDLLDEEGPTASVAFVLPRQSTVEFDRQEEAGQTLVTLTFAPKSAEDTLREQRACSTCVKVLLGRRGRCPERHIAHKPSGETP